MKNFECDILANDKNWLCNEYIIKEKSLRKIAKECGVSDDTIKTRLKKFDIEIRGHKDSNKISGKTYKRRKSTEEEYQKKLNRLRNGEYISCKNCDTPFYVNKGLMGTRKFCSRKCFLEYKRENINRNQDWRDYPEYDIWRKLVYQRDNWKCKICSSKYKINAHHIYEGKDNKSLRFEIYNGITLCEFHHIQVHKYKCSFIEESIKQTPNFGGNLEIDNPEASIREFLLSLIRSND